MEPGDRPQPRADASLTDASANGQAGETPTSRLGAPDTLWNTVYIDAALQRLRAQGYPVKDEDVARLSPYMRRHINVHGKYSFALPELPDGATRELRDPDTQDDDEGDNEEDA